MVIEGLIWLDEIINKLAQKHHVNREEVLEVLKNQPFFRYVEKGNYPKENLYSALGRTNSGRYLIVFFVYKMDRRAIIVSARDMTPSERKRYEER